MSLLNKETLKEIKEKRKQSQCLYPNASAYPEAAEALSMAITLLEQIDFITQNFEFEVKIKGGK